MSSPSQIILLLEDSRHQQFIYRYLKRLGFGTHSMRVEKSPSGAGSAEQWVRERFAIEVEARRSRQAGTKLIVIVDADLHSVRQRIGQLDQALQEAGVPIIADDANEIARLVPKRNIETWVLCLNGDVVDEFADYKGARDSWTSLTHVASEILYSWTRTNAVLPTSCVESLRFGIGELRRVRL